MFEITHKSTINCLTKNNIDYLTIKTKEELETILKQIKKTNNKNYCRKYMRELYRSKRGIEILPSNFI